MINSHYLPYGGSFIRHKEGGKSQYFHNAVTPALSRTCTCTPLTPIMLVAAIVVVMVVAWGKDTWVDGWIDG